MSERNAYDYSLFSKLEIGLRIWILWNLKYKILYNFWIFLFVSKHVHTNINFSHSLMRFLYASLSRLCINEILSLVLHLDDDFWLGIYSNLLLKFIILISIVYVNKKGQFKNYIEFYTLDVKASKFKVQIWVC